MNQQQAPDHQPYPQPAPPVEPYPAAPPPGQPHWPAPPRPTNPNGWAIASLVLGIFGGGLLALLFGAIALVQIRRRGQRGRGLAIAGMVLGLCWMLVVVAAVVFAVATGPTRDSAGAVTESGTESIANLKPGDCVNGLMESNSLLDLPVVPCTQPHQGEVFAVFDLAAGSWPGDQVVTEKANQGCEEKLGGYAPAALDDPKTEFYAIRPLRESWAKDRSVICIATSTAGQLTGSLRD